MYVKLRITNPAALLSLREARLQAEADHGGYYGTPHGHRMGLAPSRWPAIFTEESPKYGVDPIEAHLGFHQSGGGEHWAWIRSSGNFIAVECRDDWAVVVLCGARHGLQALFGVMTDPNFREAEVMVYETMAEDRGWWEVGIPRPHHRTAEDE